MSADRARHTLILRASRQDGALSARLWSGKSYEAFGASRDDETQAFANLQCHSIHDRVTRGAASVLDFRSVLRAIRLRRPCKMSRQPCTDRKCAGLERRNRHARNGAAHA